MIFVGIDPGRTGGVATILPTGEINLIPMPETWEQFADHLEQVKHTGDQIHVYIEKAQPMPKQGGVGIFTYGFGAGVIEGVCCALQLPRSYITSREWIKPFLVNSHKKGKDKKERKTWAVEVAYRLFPQVNFLATERSSKPHLGMVEALLIAEYGRRVHR